jgi:DNA-binding XRE family transcriptional regulator
MYVPSNTPKYVCYGCRNKLAVSDLEGIFHEQLKGFFFSDAEVMSYIQEADGVIREKQELLRSLEKQHKKLKSDMDKLLRLYLDGKISGDGFGLQYRPLEEQAKQLEEQIPQLQGEVDFLTIQYLSSDQILNDAKDIYTRWTELERDEKRKIIENTVERIVIGKEDVQIELGYLPSSSELMANSQRNFIPALPFCHVMLKGSKPKPAAYPVVLNTYGDRLRKKRMDLGLLQKEIAVEIGVSEATIYNWENNRVRPAKQLIPRLIKFLAGP